MFVSLTFDGIASAPAIAAELAAAAALCAALAAIEAWLMALLVARLAIFKAPKALFALITANDSAAAALAAMLSADCATKLFPAATALLATAK